MTHCRPQGRSLGSNLRIGVFERKFVRKVYGPIREEESLRIGANEIEDVLQGADVVKVIKLPRIKDGMDILKG
jgi:hypothetical protein